MSSSFVVINRGQCSYRIISSNCIKGSTHYLRDFDVSSEGSSSGNGFCKLYTVEDAVLA